MGRSGQGVGGKRRLAEVGETALVVGLAVLVVIKGGAAASGVLSGIGRMVIDLIRL